MMEDQTVSWGDPAGKTFYPIKIHKIRRNGKVVKNQFTVKSGEILELDVDLEIIARKDIS